MVQYWKLKSTVGVGGDCDPLGERFRPLRRIYCISPGDDFGLKGSTGVLISLAGVVIQLLL